MRIQMLALAAGVAGLAAPAFAQTTHTPMIRADATLPQAGVERFDEWMAKVAAQRTDSGGEVNDGRLWRVEMVGQDGKRTTIVANTPIPDNAKTERLWPGQADLAAQDASAVALR